MDKYGEVGDSLYCYSGTNILRNQFQIQDEAILQQAELELTQHASMQNLSMKNLPII
jgi:cell filamentation protein